MKELAHPGYVVALVRRRSSGDGFQATAGWRAVAAEGCRQPQAPVVTEWEVSLGASGEGQERDGVAGVERKQWLESSYLSARDWLL